MELETAFAIELEDNRGEICAGTELLDGASVELEICTADDELIESVELVVSCMVSSMELEESFFEDDFFEEDDLLVSFAEDALVDLSESSCCSLDDEISLISGA